MNSAGVELLNNSSVVGASAAQQWPGGIGVLAVGGTFGGTSLTLEWRLPDGNWAPFKTLATDGTQTTITLTASGGFQFALPCGQIRVVTAAGTPSAMYARADRISF